MRPIVDDIKLRELADSIAEQGVLEPILVRPNGSGSTFEIVAGSRRYQASQLAGCETIPAIVRELSDLAALEVALVENVQRHDMHPLDEAVAFARLHALDAAYTDEAIAAKVGKPVAYVRRRKKLLRLPAVVREAFLADVRGAGE